MKDMLFGVIAGLVVGLPQGMRDIPSLSKTGLPLETIQTIGAFGTVGGFVLGYMYSVKSPDKKIPISGYSLLLVGTLSIGIPTMALHFNGEILSSLTMPGLFFTAIGLSMIIGGAVWYVLRKNT
jgi:hypothetical protein